MTTTLSILNSHGDQTLTWDHAKPEEVARARQTIADLKAAGYSFFLVDGITPADEVTAGAGTLVVKKLTADELTEAPESAPADDSPTADTSTASAPSKRGRPRKAIAVRPIAGGSL